MSTTIYVSNDFSGKIKEVKLGYSFTTLFFGWLPDLLRQNFRWALIYFGLTFAISFVFSFSAVMSEPSVDAAALTVPLGWLMNAIWGTMRNKKLLEFYLANGFKISSADKNQVQVYLGKPIEEQFLTEPMMQKTV